MAKIDDAMKEVFDKKKKGKPVTNERIEQLRADLKQLSDVARQNAKDAAEQAAIFEAIEEARLQLSQDYIHVDEQSKAEQEMPDKFEDLRKTLQDLRDQVHERLEIQELQKEWQETDTELMARGVTDENVAEKAKSPELSALIDKRKRLQEELRIRKSLLKRIQKLSGQTTMENVRESSKNDKSLVEAKEIEDLRKELEELKRNNAEDKKVATLEKQKQDLEKELATGEQAVKEARQKQPDSPRVAKAKQDVADLKKEISKKKAIEKERKALEEKRDRAEKRLKEGKEAVEATKRTLRRPARTRENQKIQDEIDELNKQIQEKETLERKEERRFNELSDRLAKAEKELATGEKEQTQQREPSPELSQRNQELKDKIEEVKKAITIRNREEAAKKRKREKIEEYERLTELFDNEQASPVSYQRGTRDPDVEKASDAYKQAKKKLKTKKSIEKLKGYQQRMREDPNYSPPIDEPKPKKQEQDDELFLLLKEEQELKRELRDLSDSNRWAESGYAGKAGIIATEAAFAMRSIMLSGEVGFLYRQTISSALNVPQLIRTKGLVYRTFIEAIHAGWTEAGAMQKSIDMRNDPKFIDAQRAGLMFRDHNHRFNASEEYTQSWFLNKVPFLGKYIGLNDRLMSTYMNMFTHEFYYNYMERYEKKYDIDLDTKKEIAKGLMRTTGRGDAWNIGQWGRWVNLVMLAPRYLISRITAPWIQGYRATQTAAERAIFIETYGGFIVTGMGVLAAASMVPGVSVGTDPDDSDFLKIVWGNKRIDIWGGFMQPVRLVMMGAYKLLESAGWKEEDRRRSRGYEKKSKEMAAYWLSNRTSPIVNFGTSLMDQELFGGEEYRQLKWLSLNDPAPDETAYQSWKNFVAPLIYSETAEAYGLEGMESAIASFVLNQIGFGTSTYDKNARKRAKNPDPIQQWIAK
jgi:hypothetical protein